MENDKGKLIGKWFWEDRDVPVTCRRKEEKLQVFFSFIFTFLCFIYKYLAMGFVIQ